MVQESAKWIKTLRERVRHECGNGWMVRGVGSGLIQRVQLIVRFEDGTRSRIVLGPTSKTDPDFVPWIGSSSGWILNMAKEISLIMRTQGKGLEQAYALVKQDKDFDFDSHLDWDKLATRFKAYKIQGGSRSARVWNRNYRTTITRILLILKAEPKPTSGYILLKTLVDLYGGEPGSASRRLRIKYSAEFLRFAFENGVKRSWLPPEDLAVFIGQKTY